MKPPFPLTAEMANVQVAGFYSRVLSRPTIALTPQQHTREQDVGGKQSNKAHR